MMLNKENNMEADFNSLESICNLDWRVDVTDKCKKLVSEFTQKQHGSSSTLTFFCVDRIKDNRVHLCAYIWSALDQITCEITQKLNTCTDVQLSRDPSESELIGLKNLTILEKSCKFALYTCAPACLDSEVGQIFEMNIQSNRWEAFRSHPQIPDNVKHNFVEKFMKIMLNFMECHPVQNLLWNSFGVEFLGVILYLCFSPQKSKDSFFRESFQRLLQWVDRQALIQTVFLLQGIARPVKGTQNWLPNATKSLLVRRCLLHEGGVRAVIKVGLEMGETTNWKRKEALASIVSVSKHPKAADLYTNIGPQITQSLAELFRSLKKKTDDSYNDTFHVLSLTLEQILKDNPDVARKFVLNPLFRGLHETVSGYEHGQDCIEIGEEIEILHRLYVETMSPGCSMSAVVEPFLCTLGRVASSFTVTHYKNLAHQIILRHMSQLDSGECVKNLLIMCGLQNDTKSPHMKEGLLTFTPESVTFKVAENTQSLEDLDRVADCIVNLLDNLSSGNTSLQFYEKLSEQLSLDFQIRRDTNKFLLNTPQDEIESKLNAVKRITLVASLLNSLSENDKIVHSVFRDLESALPMLENFLRVGCQETEEEDLTAIKESFCLNIVMLLRFYIENRQGSEPLIRNEWSCMKQLLPLIKKVSSCNAAVRSLTHDLESLIVTHGVAGDTPRSHKKEMKKSSYEEAMEELCSPEIPVRGHALIILTRLLKEKDPVAVEKKDAILILFKHHLKEDDTYIYLQCVEGLAVLCDTYHKELVPLLTKQLVDGKKQTAENRVKLTEALTRATERLGEILPTYRNEFINALLQGCRDKDELVRASSLSNLGEVCKHLRFSLGPIVHEVFEMIANAVMHDQSVVVRRAGVMVVTLILRGLEKDIFKVLQNVLLELYRFLKTLQLDPDEAIRIHSQLALNEIDHFMRDFLTPKVSMKKKIFITEVPSS